jgi:hypothetical protein
VLVTNVNYSPLPGSALAQRAVQAPQSKKRILEVENDLLLY